MNVFEKFYKELRIKYGKPAGQLIKPSGFYWVKAQYLFCLAKFISENYQDPTQMMRKDFRLYQDFHALIVIDGKEQQ